ncbi:MAG: ABC transporter substrate-binding protein [Dehalococcoidia bacterium]|nr:ABC transporter substrate-binding protein [Dehalococcoidia bacterium]
MQHRTTGALAIAIVALFITSCSSAPPATSDTTATSDKPYGSLTIVQSVYRDDEAFDPSRRSCPTPHYALGAAIFDSLIELTPNADPSKPGLAERWEIAADGLSHTFFIRKGVKFHNGDDLTAADVKFSFDTVMAPTSSGCDAGPWRAAISSVEIKDPYTVVLRLKSPQFELLKGFNDFGASQAVIPKKYIEEKGWDNFVRNPIGSGIWKLAEYKPGVKVVLEAVEDHWRATPKFKTITVLPVSEEASRVAMLKTGELDIAMVSPDSVPGLKAAGLKVFPFDGGAENYIRLHWDLDHPELYPIGDVRVRKGLSLAMDRPELAKSLFGGYGRPSGMYYVRPSATFFDANLLKPDPFDPEGAKKLFAQGGYPTGFTMKLWVGTERPTLEGTFVQAVAGYWRKVGVNAETVPIDTAAVLGPWYRARPVNPQIYNTGWSRTASGALQFEKVVTVYSFSKGSVGNCKDPKLDELIDKVPLTRDPVEKNKIALEASIRARDLYCMIPGLNMDTILVTGPKVGEVVPIKAIEGLAPILENITHAK